ncbi:hypothetical protein ACFYYR_13270 [Streptomyces sp. NPDC001922]|uniref:hypothetical protein n=1 Tax=Streptomyces sp. NPDC001922 TaxID=3364624 RepID=UPI0036C02471
MGSDEVPFGAAGGDAARVRTGPRHAAPRKSLLTKLQIPASKALALAAMPTAVFVGMGLTPKLAQADEMPNSPFASGPCVTRSDEAQDEKKDEKEPSDKESATPGAGPSAGPSTKPSTEPSPEPSSGGDSAEKPSTGTDEPAGEEQEPSAEPTPEETKNPLDPLGVGDKIKDLFDGDDDEEEPSPTASSSASDEPDATSTAAPKPEESEKPAAGAVEDTTDKTESAIRDAAGKAGAKVEDVSEKAKESAEGEESGAEDGKKPFPCPTHDAEALANADLDEGAPLLPDEPWQLESSKLTLRGLDYKGIVEVKTYSGKVKKVLKFTAEETDIDDLHQLVEGPLGTTSHVQARKGSKSTIRDGTVTMYTEELKGKLFGLIPVTFSPDTPPPLNVPLAVFTDVHVRQAGQFGGTLTVPGMHLFNSAG